MTPIFTASELRASTGEHFAILLCEHDGQRLPLYWPNLFASTQLRARSLATNTILLRLQSLGLLYQWATINEIDLDHELVHGDFLSLEPLTQLDMERGKPYRAGHVEKKNQQGIVGGA
ncbi:hypothetical protein HFK87_14050 [Ralstonia pseudosolanacearum]|uniref:hypothetical protein n=1 Tax=Ralstonia pseudosolanacearum TaxID=1310165 RepID=UPI0020058E77|nr:hypothetical protein [Ralstonia pseudosolanacearum]MCK4128627.1 hypothetical protein [Ralstonia pseudosolanacearum]